MKVIFNVMIMLTKDYVMLKYPLLLGLNIRRH
jgi:hypothetical protein